MGAANLQIQNQQIIKSSQKCVFSATDCELFEGRMHAWPILASMKTASHPVLANSQIIFLKLSMIIAFFFLNLKSDKFDKSGLFSA